LIGCLNAASTAQEQEQRVQIVLSHVSPSAGLSRVCFGIMTGRAALDSIAEYRKLWLLLYYFN
jgi:hypothetical protein